MTLLGSSLFASAALLLLLMSIRGLRREQASAIAFAALSGYAIISGVMADALVAQFSGERYLASALIYTVGSIVLSLSCEFFGSMAGSMTQPMPQWNQHDFSRHANFALVFACVGVVLLGVSREDVLVTWSEARVESGFMTVVATFSLLLACPGIVSAFIAKRPIAFAVLLVLCITSFVLLGSRAALLCALVFALWLMLIRSQGPGRKLQVLAFAAVAGFAVHVLLRQVRGLGIGGLLLAFDDGTLLATLFGSEVNSDLSGGEAAIPKYFLFSQSASSISDFGFMSSIQRLALLPIPRVEGWIEKPVDVTYLLWAKAYEAGLFSEGQGQEILLDSYLSGSLGSLHPTLFGEYFLTGGWISLVLSTLILGAVFSLIDLAMRRIDRLTSLALCGPVLVGYLFVARGNSVVGLGYFFYLGITFSLMRFAANRLSVLRFTGSANRTGGRWPLLKGRLAAR
jgi:hypothetical protein